MSLEPAANAVVEPPPITDAVAGIGAEASSGARADPSHGVERATAHGFLWMTAQTVLNKVVSIGSQVALAWLLDREDFGLISKAFTATAFPALLYQLGVREVLVR